MSIWRHMRGNPDRRRPGRKLALLSVTLVGVLALPVVVVASQNKNYSAEPLAGATEVPQRDTPARGEAKFQVHYDASGTTATSIDYHLNVANIENVFQAHIHRVTAIVPDPTVVNGGIVVWLYPSVAPVPGPVGQGRINGRIASGTITAANLVGTLAGQPLSALIAEMNAGNTYVNVHTNDGVAPTDTGPGDFPGGEIRHQVRHHGP